AFPPDRGSAGEPSSCPRRFVTSKRILAREWLPPRLSMMPCGCRAVLGVFIRAVFGWLRRTAARHGFRNGQGGAFTVIQRFRGTLNLDAHIHSLVLRRRVHAVAGHPRPAVHALDPLTVTTSLTSRARPPSSAAPAAPPRPPA